ncbi:putative signal peptidase complex subunit 2, partial [Cucurbita argyrosperma subsp. sororia]
MATENGKKANLLNHVSVGHLIDESVFEVVMSRGYIPDGSLSSTGLVVCSKFPRFSHLYTLTISSSEPKSICANESVQLTKSVTRWFTKDGVLVEGFFWKDVEALIDDYSRGPKKNS